MTTTYMDLTNKLLRRVNEVPISQSDFLSVRGVQAFAKDAVVASIESINQAEIEWPFNAEVGTQLLVVGQTDYDFPEDLRSTRWRSFYINKDDALSTNTLNLEYVGRDYWEHTNKTADLDAGSDGRSVPTMVFEKHGVGFGVTPSPDQAYTVSYDYFKKSPTLTAYNDVSTIPSVYDEAIIQGGLYHFYMFRNDTEQADRADSRFKREIDEMRFILMGNTQTMKSTMIVKPGYKRPYGYMY